MSEQKIVTELKVSGHLMKLDTGLYCVFHGPNGHRPNPATGLPGVRISLPPGVAGAQGGVEISGFREDGWVSTGNDAALIRVSEGPAQVLVTVYQSSLGGDSLPQLQVVRLGDFRPNGVEGPAPAPLPVGLRPAEAEAELEAKGPNGAAKTGNGQTGNGKTGEGKTGEGAPAATPAAAPPVITAHIQRRGDVGGQIGEWVGERGSKLWIEGFSVAPPPELKPEDLEYQAVLGRGWLSPWSQGGQFCGSRRMALPILGLRVRLRGAAAETFECAYSASFTDGAAVGPVAAGEPCESEGLAPLEAFQVMLRPRKAATRPAAGRPVAPARPAATPPARQAAPARPGASAKPAVRKPHGPGKKHAKHPGRRR
jgi:hypothetical protein